MPEVSKEPALPWGAASASASPQDSEGLTFEETIRKMVLAAAVDLHDRGDMGRPAKRARNEEGGANDSATAGTTVGAVAGGEVADGAALAASLVDPFVQHLGQAVPVQLAAEQRIQVKWQLNRDDGEEPKWWGATLLRECAAPAPAAPAGGGADAGQSIAESLGGGPLAIRSAPKAAVWIMRYDAYDGFEEEEKEAAFITDHVLAHTDDLEEMMAWRIEGQEYEPSECSDSDEETNDSKVVATTGGSKTTAAELREYGGSLEQAAMHRMSSVPAAAQQHIASKLSEYTTKLAATLKQLIQDKDAEGNGGTISGNDMREALARMQ